MRTGGQDALTLRALGDHCGLSRGAPYRHFEDKDALVRAVAAAGLTELTKRMTRAARPAKDGTVPLRKAMQAYVKWATTNPDWYSITFQHRAATPASGVEDPELKAAALGLLSYVTSLVEQGQVVGDVPPGPPERVVGILWATLHGAVDLFNSATPNPSSRRPHRNRSSTASWNSCGARSIRRFEYCLLRDSAVRWSMVLLSP